MAIKVNIETNIPDVLDVNEQFILKEGQSRVKGEVVLRDGAEFIFPDKSSLIVEE